MGILQYGCNIFSHLYRAPRKFCICLYALRIFGCLPDSLENFALFWLKLQVKVKSCMNDGIFSWNKSLHVSNLLILLPQDAGQSESDKKR